MGAGQWMENDLRRDIKGRGTVAEGNHLKIQHSKN